jgi:hypothetical protein
MLNTFSLHNTFFFFFLKFLCFFLLFLPFSQWILELFWLFGTICFHFTPYFHVHYIMIIITCQNISVYISKRLLFNPKWTSYISIRWLLCRVGKTRKNLFPIQLYT